MLTVRFAEVCERLLPENGSCLDAASWRVKRRRRGPIVNTLRGLARRPMTSPLRLLFAALAALALCSAAAAQNSPAAQQVLNRARAASGGAGWNSLRGVHEVGQDGEVRYERWFDPVRYGLRIETHPPGGKLVQGFNGAGEWRILASGTQTGSVAAPVLAQVRSDAFFGAYGFYFPSRFDMRSSHLGVRESQGRSFDVLRVQPAGGEPRELWFDRDSGLLGRIVDNSGPRAVTTELSDYRRVGPVRAPFAYTTYGGDLPRPQTRKVEAIDFKPADRGQFSLPRPPQR